MVQVGGVVMFSITRTTYNAVSVHGSRRPRYNGAAVNKKKKKRQKNISRSSLIKVFGPTFSLKHFHAHQKRIPFFPANFINIQVLFNVTCIYKFFGLF